MTRQRASAALLGLGLLLMVLSGGVLGYAWWTDRLVQQQRQLGPSEPVPERLEVPTMVPLRPRPTAVP